MRIKKKRKTNEKHEKSLRSSKKKLFLMFMFGSAFYVFVVYSFYVILLKQFKISDVLAVYLSIGFALVCLICIRVVKSVRCFFFLLLPQVFSKRGRAAVVAYVFMLTLLGPTKNLVDNIDVMAESLSCGQEQLKIALENVIDAMKVPFLALKEAVKQVLAVLEKTIDKVKKQLLNIKKIVNDLVKTIQKGFGWLGGIVNVCNKETGTPFAKCSKVFENAIDDCRVKLGIASFLCNVTYLVKTLCYSVKFIDYLCELIDFISDSVLREIQERDKEWSKSNKKKSKNENFSLTHIFQENISLEEINEDIVDEVKQRSQFVLNFFGYINVVCSFFFICVILKTIRYKSKFMSDNRFDNFYITQKFRDIDAQRLKLSKDTILPLTRKERNKFIEISSCRLIKKEKRKILGSGFFLFISSFYISCILLADYCLFWLLAIINFHGSQELGVDTTSELVQFNITGKGFVADLCKDIVGIFKPLVKTESLDPFPCLPKPKIPDYIEYRNITLLLIACWILIILEPYGLRIRQVVMADYYPVRTNERAVWLYNHILRQRTSFVKFARREMRRKFCKNSTVKNDGVHITFMQILRAKVNNIWLLRKIFGSNKDSACMLCGSSFSRTDDYARCQRPGCSGIYCSDCYAELNNTCSLCMEPMEYGDYSDISEEVDSSDEKTRRII